MTSLSGTKPYFFKSLRINLSAARLTREVEALRADNAKLRAKLNLPSKTPENSSTPPSQVRKVSGEERKTPEGKRRNSHAGGTSDKARTL